MVLKHIWVGKDGTIKRSLLLHAADGLSPFLVMDLHEDGVAKTCGVHESMTREQSQSTTTLSLLRVTHLLSLFQLLWHLAVTRKIWFVADDEANDADDDGGDIPRQIRLGDCGQVRRPGRLYT